ncbi:hypothetical protein V1477_002171 [Vespula maculifrons]|uniref:Uncharacterized protein n=1 Tax=Vespula maculifrons TaxID=7453 RepID=A0ABD2CVR4_VESMC
MVEKLSGSKLSWIGRCSIKHRSSGNTLFEGKMCRISLQDIVTIVICFISQIKVSEVIENLRSWRHQRGDNELSCKTKYLVVMAKKKIDVTFLTKRKYHLDRITEQMSIIVLSIYCKEDKIKLVNPMISRICTDNAKQYHSVEEIISSSCMQLNQSIVEFVAADDCMNTINNLEAQNKLLKRAIVFWKKAVVLYQYMVLYCYRKNILEKQYRYNRGLKVTQFFENMKRVYPGY